MNRLLNNRIWIKGLVMQCPHGVPVNDCPLNGLRNLPIAEANRIINDTSDAQVMTYLKTHRQCYNRRLETMISSGE
jgi:hypothetical protein